MENFQAGETIILEIEVTNSGGTKVSPATSTTITITSPSGTDLVSAAAMTEDDTGEFHYDYTAPSTEGVYDVLYILTNTTRVTKATDRFRVIGVP